MNATDQKNQLLELKPCPFCGGEAQMDSDQNMRTSQKEFSVLCRNEKCLFPVETLVFGTPQAAAESWNSRVACQSIDELQPCPFCGFDAGIHSTGYGYGAGCLNRRCFARESLLFYSRFQDARDAWNERA